MSLHESQSLFIEMQIVKTKEFNEFLETTLCDKFKKTSLPWKTENLHFKRNKLEKDSLELKLTKCIIHCILYIGLILKN